MLLIVLCIQRLYEHTTNDHSYKNRELWYDWQCDIDQTLIHDIIAILRKFPLKLPTDSFLSKRSRMI